MNEARRGGEVQSFVLLPAVALVLGGYWTTSAVSGAAMFAMTAVAVLATTSSLCVRVGSGSNGSNVVAGRGGGS